MTTLSRRLLAATTFLAFSPLAATADIVTRENITGELGIVKMTIPKIEADVSPASKAAFESLFLAGANEPLHIRLARVEAARISIPELRLEASLKEGRMTISYKNMVFSKVAGGKAAAITIAATTTTTEIAGKPASESSSGQTTVAEADAAFMIRWFTDSRGGGSNEPLRPLYKAYSVENTVSKDPAGTEMRIARVSGTEFKARLLATAPADLLPIFSTLTGGAKPSKETLSAIFRFGIDIFQSVDWGSGEIADMTMKLKTPTGSGDGKIRQIFFGPGADSGKAGMVMSGFDMAMPEGKFSMGRMAAVGFSPEPVFRHILETLDKHGDIEKVDPLKMIPGLGTFRINDIAFDGKADGGKGERIAGTIKLYEIVSGEQLNGIPTALRVAIDGLSFPLPADTKEQGLRDLRAMGFTRIDIGTQLDVAWNAPASELTIREVSIRGADMGTVKISGLLGGVTPDVFSGDKALMTAAAMGATAKAVNILVENKGLFEKALAKAAKDQGAKPDDLRQQMTAIASLGIPAALGNAQAAKTLGAAVARFIAKPGTLTISAKTKDGSGLGLVDFLTAASNPAALLDKLTVDAKSE